MAKGVAGKKGITSVLALAGTGALITGAMLMSGAGAANAVETTDTITGSGTSGTLNNGVTWTSTGALTDGSFGLKKDTDRETQTISLSSPASKVTFSVFSLADGECVTLPKGVSLVSKVSQDTYDASKRQICGGNNSNEKDLFEVDDTSSLTFTSSGTNTTMVQHITDIQITADDEPAPVATWQTLSTVLGSLALAGGGVAVARRLRRA